VINLVMIEHY